MHKELTKKEKEIYKEDKLGIFSKKVLWVSELKYS